jgi:7-cyano-7-deazaguanine synthase
LAREGENMNEKIAVMSLSGGMDSTGLMLRLVNEGKKVYALSFDYGQKHSVELIRARMNIDYLMSKGIEVNHRIVDISGAMGIFKGALTQSDVDVPEGHYEQSNMKATVVPNRNAIFSSLIYGYALSIALEQGEAVSISLGVHSGDHAIYPDCRPEFYDSLHESFALGNWDSHLVRFDLPYLKYDKAFILRDSFDACDSLGLDFDTVFANTNTSYNPDKDGRSSGKSGADVERILAFIEIGRKDPVEYVDGWESARANALKVEQEWAAINEA